MIIQRPRDLNPLEPSLSIILLDFHVQVLILSQTHGEMPTAMQCLTVCYMHYPDGTDTLQC